MIAATLSRQSVRERATRWFESRLPLSDSITLAQRTVYILPTRPGLMLGVTILVLLAAAINYQLSLGYLLTFMLSGCAVVGMHVSHSTLRGLGLHITPPAPQFADAAVQLEVILTSNRRRTRHGIGVSVRDSNQWVWADVPGQGRAQVQLRWSAPGRGRHRVPTLTAETRFPLGTFRVWTVWRPASEVLIYPAPEARPPALPQAQTRGEGNTRRNAPANGDYDGVRAYQRGDTLKQIVWKKLAKSEQLVSRDREHQQHDDLWLDLAQTGFDGALERQLERLCAWVLLADRRGSDYGLRLPGVEIAPSNGEAHKRRCLEALALC